MYVETNDVKGVLREAVRKYIGIQIEDDQNLLSSEYQAILADFLYVLKDLEEAFGPCVYRVIECHNYTVFTINNLAKAVVEACALETTTVPIS